MKILIAWALLLTGSIAYAEIESKPRTDLTEAQSQASQDRRAAVKKWRELVRPDDAQPEANIEY